MPNSIKVTLYLVLVILAAVFAYRFKVNYRSLTQSGKAATTDLDVQLAPDGRKGTTSTRSRSSLGGIGAGFLACVVGLGLLAAADISRYVAAKAMKAMYDEDAQPNSDPEYDSAEEVWASGDHLEAIRLMREYLARNPREQYVALRIAEIYEKDLSNHLAAALEYEEVLTKKLPPERWGWAAIHLCNLYNGKLDKPEKATALLRRIEAEFPQTAAASKARKRLAMLDGTPPPAGENTPATDG